MAPPVLNLRCAADPPINPLLCSVVAGVATWHSGGMVHLCRLAVAYGPAFIAVLVGLAAVLAQPWLPCIGRCRCQARRLRTPSFTHPHMQGYCLVLLDCDLSLVGLALLLLLAASLTCQPSRGRWRDLAGGNDLQAVMRGEAWRSGVLLMGGAGHAC